jgi:hypothetical protein
MSASIDRQPTRRSRAQSFEHKLAAYAVASGAFLVSADRAEAGIIYSGVRNIPIGNEQTVDLNVNDTGPLSDIIVDFKLRQTNLINGLNQTLTLSIIPQGTNEVVLDSGGFAAALKSGDPISSLDTLGNASKVMASYKFKLNVLQSSSGPWRGADDKFLGLYFEIPGSDFHFGWARVNMKGDKSAEATLVDWAYETSANTPIIAGAVPEPSSLSLGFLALGAVGVAALIRSRQGS